MRSIFRTLTYAFAGGVVCFAAMAWSLRGSNWWCLSCVALLAISVWGVIGLLVGPPDKPVGTTEGQLLRYLVVKIARSRGMADDVCALQSRLDYLTESKAPRWHLVAMWSAVLVLKPGEALREDLFEAMEPSIRSPSSDWTVVLRRTRLRWSQPATELDRLQAHEVLTIFGQFLPPKIDEQQIGDGLDEINEMAAKGVARWRLWLIAARHGFYAGVVSFHFIFKGAKAAGT